MSDTETETIVDEDIVCLGCECCAHVCEDSCCCCGYSSAAYCMQDACTSVWCCDCCENAGCQKGCRKCWGVLCCSCLRCEPIDWLYTCNGGLCGVEEEDRYCCKGCTEGLAGVGSCFACFRKCLYGDPTAAPRIKRGVAGCCGLCECIHNKWGDKGLFFPIAIFTAFCSILDTVTDSLLVYKWMSGHDPTDKLFDTLFPFTKDDVDYDEVTHRWEAWTLVGFLAFAWITSGIFSLFWSPFKFAISRPDDYESRCPKKAKWCLFPFHLIGLGPFVETVKAMVNSDWDMPNARANINPYRWIEFCFESGPSALLALWIISKNNLKVAWDANEGQTQEDLRLENFTTFANLLFMSSGICSMLVFHIEQDYSATLAMKTARAKAPYRWVGATLLIWCDIVFRAFIVILWMHFAPFDLRPMVSFGLVFGALLVVEVFMVAMNGQIAGCLQYPIVAYTSVYQGGLYYFSRTWEDEDHKKKTIPLFWVRWLVNVGLYLVCFFVLAKTNVSKYWNYGIIISGSLLPLLFYLKPSTKTFREAYPKVTAWQQDHDDKVEKGIQMAKNWFSSRTNDTSRKNPMSPTATSDMV